MFIVTTNHLATPSTGLRGRGEMSGAAKNKYVCGVVKSESGVKAGVSTAFDNK